MRINATLDLIEFDAAIKSALRHTSDLRPLWKKVKGPIRKDQSRHIKEQKDIDGAKFKPLAKSTLAKRRSGLTSKSFTKKGRLRKTASRRINRVLGKKMAASVKTTSKKDFLQIRRRVSWFDAHQGGARVGRGAHLPARTYMYLDQNRVDDVAMKLKMAVKRHIERGR